MAKRIRTAIVTFFIMKITSPAFRDGDPLPKHFAREHGNVSPPLTFSDLPPGTRSLALIMNDPDAPHGTFTHWIAYNFPASTRELTENRVPPGTVLGKNDFGDLGYGGPRPPSGTHRYVFRAYALDASLDLPPGVSVHEVEKALDGHVIESAELVGRFSAVKPDR